MQPTSSHLPFPHLTGASKILGHTLTRISSLVVTTQLSTSYITFIQTLLPFGRTTSQHAVLLLTDSILPVLDPSAGGLSPVTSSLVPLSRRLSRTKGPKRDSELSGQNRQDRQYNTNLGSAKCQVPTWKTTSYRIHLLVIDSASARFFRISCFPRVSKVTEFICINCSLIPFPHPRHYNQQLRLTSASLCRTVTSKAALQIRLARSE